MADIMVKILMKGAKAIGKTAVMQKRGLLCTKTSTTRASGWCS